MFKDYEYKVTRKDNTTSTLTGVYSICDGGYHKWVSLIASQKNPTSRREKIYTKRQESARKRIECLFGILKKRWRILTNGLTHEGLVTCDNLMRTACIMHNMLLECDGLDDIGRFADDWEQYHLNEVEIHQPREMPEIGYIDTPVMADLGYDAKRALLVEHMEAMHDRRELWNLRKASDCRPGRRVI
jgi:hypothetical protein